MDKKQKNLTLTLFILIIGGLLAGLIWWLKPDSAAMPAPSINMTTAPDPSLPLGASETIAPTEGATTSLGNVSAFSTGLENMPKSLRDTDVDGEIIIDENKQLVVTEGLRRLFDYFLSALGEEDEATIIARVEAYIRHHTPEPAASSAVEIFHQYIDYLKALEGIENNYGNLQMQATRAGELDLNLVAQRRQDVNQLRRQYFNTQTIDAFFGADDTYEDYSMAMVRIEQDDSLNAEQKQASREDYISRLPDGPIKQNYEQQANLGKLMQRTQEMKAAGASAEELFAMRRELVGEPAARRLAQVDAEDADFDARFTQYQAQKQALIHKMGGEANAREQIASLESHYFNELERKRLTGYAALKESLTSNSQ